MVGYREIHSLYHSHRVTLKGDAQSQIAKILAGARVELVPHQADAALFALKAPLEKGVLLADEVGLGKTVEAGLVIAQKWAENKRKILLVVPSTLRRQWKQELAEKFSIPAIVLDGSAYKKHIKSGGSNPFAECNGVIISSYEYASARYQKIEEVNWDLAIFDEAHRLRNIVKDGKRARRLHQATVDAFKLLLTATPLQNSLDELAGLVYFIDPEFVMAHGTTKAGKGKKHAVKISPEKLLDWVNQHGRRTLRKQIQRKGLLKFPKRLTRTFDFEPSAQEDQLYKDVLSFLQQPNTIAYGREKKTKFLKMTIPKLIGSSPAATSQHLSSKINKLRKLKAEAAGEAPEYLEKLESELKILSACCDLAQSIKVDTKGKALAKHLPEALADIEKKGGQRKAVIFTESLPTQQYLYELLSDHGYKDQIVLMSGNSKHPEIDKIYKAWKKQNKGTDAISGSVPLDKKSAIVDAFRSSAKSILIATESGAEGLNLQFCSLVVNYDLPWNPQRVEQRIGRCHRFGQKNDVTVINMLNTKNLAEKHILELLQQKFKLFSGAFGVSNEILGTIESGVDFANCLSEIYMTASSADEIQKKFKKLESELASKIKKAKTASQKQLFAEMDSSVIASINGCGQKMQKQKLDFEQRLVTIVRAVLPDAEFENSDSLHFLYEGRDWSPDWQEAQDNGWHFFHLSETSFAGKLVESCKNQHPSWDRATFTFEPDLGFGKHLNLSALKGKTGWLQVDKAVIKSAGILRERLLLSCITEKGKVISDDLADRILKAPCREPKMITLSPNTQKLSAVRDNLLNNFTSEEGALNDSWLAQEEEKLQGLTHAEIQKKEIEINDLEKKIQESKKIKFSAKFTKLQHEIAENTKNDETKLSEMKAQYLAFKGQSEKDNAANIRKLKSQYAFNVETEKLFTIRWRVV
nr:SNF2-related protein [uncultured Cohaesibacter sp.]